MQYLGLDIMNKWLYNNKEFILNEDDNWHGFVYLITNLTNDKKYIGKKSFWARRSKKIKGRKNRKWTLQQSDWQKYFGSNKELKEHVIELGEDKFKREILHLCKSKGECSYLEAKEQFDRKVLLGEDYYNRWISVRVNLNKTIISSLNANL